MRVLIIGGSGFIGRYISSELSSNNIPVTVFDRHADESKSTESLCYRNGDFGKREQLESVIAQHPIDRVVHLASSTLPQSSNENPRFDVQSNVCDSISLLDLCVKYKIKKVLFMSSGGTVYGVPQINPVDETHRTYPICSYGITKLAIEKYLSLYYQLYGLKYAVLRAGNPYGPWQDHSSNQGVISVYANRILTGMPLYVWGNGEVVRDYFHVRDLAILSKRALMSDQCGVWNAGSGFGTSINRLIHLLSDITNIKPEISYGPSRAFDVPEIVLDCNKARRAFNWYAKTSLSTGLSDVVQWLRRRGDMDDEFQEKP